jgi:PqqA family
VQEFLWESSRTANDRASPSVACAHRITGVAFLAAALNRKTEVIMAWTTPVLFEIRIGLEINGYLPAEF